MTLSHTAYLSLLHCLPGPVFQRRIQWGWSAVCQWLLSSLELLQRMHLPARLQWLQNARPSHDSGTEQS